MAVQDQVWLITGASSGFGEALAKAVLDAGGTVVATFRKAEQAEAFKGKGTGRAHAVLMDVTDKRSVDAGVATALNTCGRIDVLVNNAGYALRALIEQVSDEEAWHQLDTNVMGILRVSRAVLPSMRAQGSGRIMNISSAAGSHCFPMMGLYSASKHAVNGLTDSMAQEVAQFGVKVTCVEPGGFRTNFAKSSMVTSATAAPEPYVPLVSQMDASLADSDAVMPGNPALAAEKLIALAQLDEPPQRLALGDDACPWITGSLRNRIEQYEASAELGQGTSFSS